MSGPGASHGEMPGFPFPGRPGRELDESLPGALLDRRSHPPDAPEQQRVAAGTLACLAGRAGPGELAGEAVALLAFTRAVSRLASHPRPDQSGRGRPGPSLR